MSDDLQLSGHLKSVWQRMKNPGFVIDTSEPIEFHFELTGKERPVDPNMEYNRARHFDPTTGKWMSQDPLGFDAGDDQGERIKLSDGRRIKWSILGDPGFSAGEVMRRMASFPK